MARAQLAAILFLAAIGTTSAPKCPINQKALPRSAQNSANQNGEDTSSFLIARRELQDPLFQKTVVLMLPLVDEDVVVGLIVNKPTRITLHVLFPKNPAYKYKNESEVAYFGGPVDMKTVGVLFRSTKAFKPAVHLSGDLYVTFDPNLIEKIMKKPKEISNARLFLGRSQWGPDQLAGEMERGSWFGEKKANSVVFRPDTANVWRELIEELDPGNVAQARNFRSSSAGGM